MRYHGGKWRLAPWIISHFGPHRVYVEPYGGGASVLLRKDPSYAEVYNDLDQGVVTLFRVLRDRDLSAELVRRLELTPFARLEFEGCYEPSDDPVEVARRLVARSFMGFGSPAASGDSKHTTGFRADSNKSGTTPAHDWVNLPPHVSAIAIRIRGVVIERRPALQVMATHDGPRTLHYVDPPYVHATRSQGGNPYCKKHHYRFEMTDEDHLDLLAFLQTLVGMVVLSGYPHPMYDEALRGWTRLDRNAHADGARERTECLWLNPQAVAAMPQPQLLETT